MTSLVVVERDPVDRMVREIKVHHPKLFGKQSHKVRHVLKESHPLDRIEKLVGLKNSDWYWTEEFGLPKTFDVKEIKASREKNSADCMLCEQRFGKFYELHYCMRCARAVCVQCSGDGKKLCKKNANKYRTCDLCVVALENVEL